jgi:hypothetical protein
MKTTKTHTEHLHKVDSKGIAKYVETITYEIEVDEFTEEEIIAEKEEQLLAMYTEIQKLKQQL